MDKQFPYKEKFKEIQPYYDSQVPEVLAKLVRERPFLGFFKMFFPEYSTRELIKEFLKIKTVKEFQLKFIYHAVERILRKTQSVLSYSGLEKFSHSEPHVFISNHRDIILDSAILNYLLAKNGMDTVEIAIGSNLLIEKWIEDLAKLNRTFIVIRDAPKKKLYHYSINLSEYIRFTITEKKVGIWIAQREGRTKDGDDKTQISVLKMLGMSGENNFADNIAELNIVPLSIMYEYEPCDISKVRELYKKQTENYKKTKLDDLTSMARSFETKKGRIHFAFGTPVNKFIEKYKHTFKNRNDFYQKLAQFIDNQIYTNYRLFPNNYVAADMYFATDEFEKYYTPEDKQIFTDYMEKAVSEIDGEQDVIRRMFLKIYAMPVKNHFDALKNPIEV